MSEELDRYYLILGLEPGAPPEEVRLAYRDCVDAWHPDRFTHSPERQQRAQARLRQINEAYEKLRNQPRPPSGKRPSSATPTPDHPSGAQRQAAGYQSSQNGTAYEKPRDGAKAHHSQASASDANAPRDNPSPWLELTNESRFTVSALYFSALSIIVAAGCGVTLGGIHGGPIGAVSGLLASPLAGVAVGGLAAAISCVIAGRLSQRSADSIGGAIGYLLPGVAVGIAIVWSVFHVLVGVEHLHALHLLFGGACGGGLGAALGAWTGKAIAEARAGAR